MKKLVLFDIDGTLLTVHGAGAAVMRETIAASVGFPLNAEGYSMSGKTDTQIVLELVARSGGDTEAVFPILEKIWAAYTEKLAAVLATIEPLVLPGVRELLAELAAQPEDILLGLLTGNVEKAAWLKLQRINVAHHFRFGAFGNGAKERALLPPIAVTKVHTATGKHFKGKDIVIIGDTPNDILCGQALGVKSIAVATGKFTLEQLASHNPDALFADLSDTKQVQAAIWA
jgi:phosphoglycolate phosphatase